MKKILPFGLLLFLLACSGTRPANLGVQDGKLAPCPDSPNCVSSQEEEADEEHYIKAFQYDGDTENAIANLVMLMDQDGKLEIISQKSDYLHIEYTVPVTGWVDDLEFYFPAGETYFDARSASRVGHSDMGANRRRMEQIRSDFKSI